MNSSYNLEDQENMIREKVGGVAISEKMEMSSQTVVRGILVHWTRRSSGKPKRIYSEPFLPVIAERVQKF